MAYVQPNMCLWLPTPGKERHRLNGGWRLGCPAGSYCRPTGLWRVVGWPDQIRVPATSVYSQACHRMGFELLPHAITRRLDILDPSKIVST